MRAQHWQEPTLQRWLDKSLSVPNNSYLSVGEFQNELFRALQESKGTASVFLREEVDPHRGTGKAHWKIHVADTGGIDLLKDEYEAVGLQMVLIESANFLLVQITPTETNLSSSDTKRAYLLRLVGTVVKTDTIDHHWHFLLPTDMGACWSDCLLTNEGAPPVLDLQSRHDRADILVREGVVYFIFYKKIEQRFGFRPDDKWFSTQLRAAVRAKTR